jgi:hypothetical protein
MTIRFAAILSMLALAVAAGSCGGGGCPDKHILLVQNENLGNTSTCGPEAITDVPQITTSGTVITARYRTQLIVCGGDIKVELGVDGGTLTLTEKAVNLEGVCGCYNLIDMTVRIEACEAGAYTLVIDDVEYPVTF